MRKGITAVVSLVFLILITIAIIALFYGRVNFYTQKSEGSTQELKRTFNTEIENIGISNQSEGVTLYLKNTGEETWNTSSFYIQMGVGKEQNVPFSVFTRAHPGYARSSTIYTFTQGGEKFFIDPYENNMTGSEWYPDSNQIGNSPIADSVDSAAIALYVDTDTSKEYLVVTNQNANVQKNTDPSHPQENCNPDKSHMFIDFYDIPSQAQVVHSDGVNGEGPSCHGHDEFSLQHEPEGNWGYLVNQNCCYDGGVMDLSNNWNQISMDPIFIDHDLHLYADGNGSVQINDTEPITLTRTSAMECFDQDETQTLVEPGEIYKCQTGLNLPPPGERLKFQVKSYQYGKTWLFECTRRRKNVAVC